MKTSNEISAVASCFTALSLATLLSIPSSLPTHAPDLITNSLVTVNHAGTWSSACQTTGHAQQLTKPAMHLGHIHNQ